MLRRSDVNKRFSVEFHENQIHSIYSSGKYHHNIIMILESLVYNYYVFDRLLIQKEFVVKIHLYFIIQTQRLKSLKSAVDNRCWRARKCWCTMVHKKILLLYFTILF